MTSSGSDSSEPVIVSHPSSPTPSRNMSTPLSSTASRQLEPVVIKDTETEHVAALSPTEPDNQTHGLGQTGQAQLERLNAHSVLGGTDAVVGPAHGEAPEYIATLKRQGTNGTIEEGDEDHDDGNSKSGPKWLKKVKDGVSSIKEKAASSSASIRDRSDTGSITGSIFSRDRTTSQTNASRISNQGVQEPHTIITDGHGNPVPVDIGAPDSNPPPPVVNNAVKRDDFARPSPGSASLVDSTTTSVKDKVLESFDVEPRTSQEKFHSMFKDISNREELIEGESLSRMLPTNDRGDDADGSVVVIDYRCALVRDIPVQGKLYLSEHYLSFHAAILGTSA